ncbi:hypothetical protein [Rhizobacter sp. OV335]|uniref:hypothetical protein n=1 Tax=Rhizobacter sp. OV335 TaxID=1500264 RepID=UPI000915D942|nr:hypothetical protein [Rhizobacter sp. OV335]SHN37349.1 hypothetical protein SAMN02787076_05698 [Rhizobacter sp. OV335]
MHDLLITKIERFNPTSESASVTLGCVDGQVVAFCFPCSYEVGDLVPNRLYVLDSTKLQSPYFNDWADEEQAQASRERLHRTRDYAYSGCGKVIDPHDGLVQVCGFILDFGDVPPGAEFVEFDITRLDLR